MNIYDNAILQDSIRKEERARLLWRNQNRKKKEDEASLRELESTWVQEPNGGYRERFMGSQTARFHKTTMSRTSAYPPMNFAAERYAPVVKTPVARNLAGHAQLHAGKDTASHMKIAGQSNVKVITNEFPHHGKDTRGNLAVGSLVPNEAPVKNQNADAKPYRRTKPRSIANGGGMTVRVRGKKGSRSEAPFWQEPTPIRLPKRAAQIAREQAKLFAQTQRAQARDPSTIDYNLENYPRPLDFHKTMSTTARRAAPRRKSSQQAPKQKAGVGSRALKQSEARSSGSIAHVIHPLAASGLGYGSAHNNYYDYVYSGFFPSLERAGYKAHLNAKLSSTNSVPDSLVNSTALYHSQRRLW